MPASTRKNRTNDALPRLHRSPPCATACVQAAAGNGSRPALLVRSSGTLLTACRMWLEMRTSDSATIQQIAVPAEPIHPIRLSRRDETLNDFRRSPVHRQDQNDGPSRHGPACQKHRHGQHREAQQMGPRHQRPQDPRQLPACDDQPRGIRGQQQQGQKHKIPYTGDSHYALHVCARSEVEGDGGGCRENALRFAALLATTTSVPLRFRGTRQMPSQPANNLRRASIVPPPG